MGSTFSSLACGLFLPPPLLASAAGSSLRLGWEASLYSECHYSSGFMSLPLIRPAGTHPLTVTNSSHLVGLTLLPAHARPFSGLPVKNHCRFSPDFILLTLRSDCQV